MVPTPLCPPVVIDVDQESLNVLEIVT